MSFINRSSMVLSKLYLGKNKSVKVKLWVRYNCLWSGSFKNSKTSKCLDLISLGSPNKRDSKLAVILWMRQMARMHKTILFFSVHPGICRTNLFRHCNNPLLGIILSFEEKYPMLTKSPAEGAKSSIYLAYADKSFLTRYL